MGYYTTHTLKVHGVEGEPVNDKAIMAELKKKNNTPERDAELLQQLKMKPLTVESIIEDLRVSYEDARYALDRKGNTSNTSKWYNRETELRTFSKKYPGVVFELRGEGEDSADLWIQYYRNGKMQICKAILTYPPFDEKELK
jgi:hypothetical protein